MDFTRQRSDMANRIEFDECGDGGDTEQWRWLVYDENDRLLASSPGRYGNRLQAVCGLFGGLMFASYNETEFMSLYAEYEATLPKESYIKPASSGPKE